MVHVKLCAQLEDKQLTVKVQVDEECVYTPGTQLQLLCELLLQICFYESPGLIADSDHKTTASWCAC